MYLELDRLSKQFDGKYAVHDLSLGLEEGGLLCILGSSGCGKTTTLNMIGGFLKPDGGRVLLDGQDITALPPERRVPVRARAARRRRSDPGLPRRAADGRAFRLRGRRDDGCACGRPPCSPPPPLRP